MAEAVKHDYHLVNPSPWPLVGSIAATVMLVGVVVWMKGLFGLEVLSHSKSEACPTARDRGVLRVSASSPGVDLG